MESYVSNNKRLVKNTILLYFRMILTMAISLYTSRIILETLGVSDYGVYSVTGGLIMLLTYVNTILSGGTSRFLTIALGRNDLPRLKLTFSTTVTLSIISSVIIFILGETIGLWFVNTQLNIDLGRMEAALWVYQCALFSAMLTVTQAPFSASLISHERMDVYAYMSIFDVTMKLLIVYILLIFDFDKLKLYAILMLCVNFLNVLIYRWYCIKKFEECSLRLAFDKKLLKSMFTYSSWNMLGTLSTLLIDQGINILINMFYGTVVNAARGVAMQVNNIIRQMYGNFQMPCRPQVMKYYAAGEIKEMQALICNNSKYCSYLLLCVIIPLSINVKGLLEIWLVEVPEYTVEFVRFIFAVSFINAMTDPIAMGIQATGKVKRLNIAISIVNATAIIAAYLLFCSGASPVSGYVPLLVSCMVNVVVHLYLLSRLINFDVRIFLFKVIIPVIKFSIICIIIPLILYMVIPLTTIGCLLGCILSGISVGGIIFIFGIPVHIKRMLINKLLKLNLKNKNGKE